MGTTATAAHPTGPSLDCPTGRRDIIRKSPALSLPTARLFPGTSSWTPKMLGHCGWDVTTVGTGNFQVHSPPAPLHQDELVRWGGRQVFKCRKI